MFSRLLGGYSGKLNWNHRQIIQQATFVASFIPFMNNFDIIHTADLYLALVLQRLKQRGILAAELIYCDGSCFDLTKLRVFRFVQETAPQYVSDAAGLGIDTSGWYVIPNFVDTELFSPGSGDHLRSQLGIPNDAFVILSVGALDSNYKRMDWLVREVALIPERVRKNMVLLLVGSREDGTASLLRLGTDLLGHSFRAMVDVDRSLLPAVYRCADAFALASINERFGLVFLEAMASGLPILHHDFPVTNWIVGDGGVRVNMASRGLLAKTIMHLMNCDSREMGKRGRARARGVFDVDVVIPKIIAMYRDVASESRKG